MRENKTHILLWVAVLYTAITAHLLLGGGGYVVGVIHTDTNALATLGSQVRERVRRTEATFEVGSIDVGAKPAEEVEPPKPPEPPKPEAKKEKQAVPEPTTPQPKVPPPKEEKKIPLLVEKKKEEEKKQPPPPPMDKRIAVKQHVQPKQEDNPNARFVGDEANKVEQETAATQTAHDQDDPNPTPGGQHTGNEKRMGDSEHTKIADSEQHAGDKNRAPGEKGTELDVQPPAAKPMGPVAIQAPSQNEPPRSGGDNRAPAPQNDTAPTPALPPGAMSPPTPEVMDNPAGTWSFNPTRPGAVGGVASQAGPGQQNPNAPGRPMSQQMFGLGGHPGPGQVNLNLNQTGVIAIVGQDQLHKERVADGERRKSEHRGSWTASNFERWRSAIENYVSTVKPGNQTSLNTAAVPFATFLVGMHNRIHPIFADSFLGSLDGLPVNHPMNDQKLITRLEIVLSRDGRLVKMGIVKTSGVTAFDIAALDAVQRASPFSTAPTAIVSPDGRVYLHWEFHRDEVYACSTINARPFMLNVPAQAPPVDPSPSPTQPQPPNPAKERGAPPANVQDTREGMWPAARPARQAMPAGKRSI
jgi:TonB family protein